MSDSPSLGIDFGTTTSLVAFARPVTDPRGVEPSLVPVDHDESGAPLDALPSLLYFPSTRKLVIGEAAREQLGLRPDRVVRRLKQLLGRFPRVAVAGRAYTTTDLAAAVFRRLKRAADAHLGVRVRDAVVTVPASFDATRRRALLDALAAAGFAVRANTLLDEPVAALAAYLHGRTSRRLPPPARVGLASPPAGNGIDFSAERTVLLLDVGGGTSDACVARVRPDGDGLAVELLALSRFTPVGGDDFDACVARGLIDRFAERSGLDLDAMPKGDRLLFQHRMILTAERAKRDLSSPPADGVEPVAHIRQMFLHGTHHLLETIDRARYAELVAGLLADPRVEVPSPAVAAGPGAVHAGVPPSAPEAGTPTSEPRASARGCLPAPEPRASASGPPSPHPGAPLSVLDAPWDALRKAGLQPSDLDAVLLAGGMALVPAVVDAVRALFDREPIVVPSPLTAIVAGAVVQAFTLAGGRPGLRPAAAIAAESIGVRTAGGGFRRLIGAGTPLPARVVERGAFALPHGWGRYVRIPIAEGDEARPDRCRSLATLALRFPRRLPADSRVTLEASLDENKVLSVRGFLDADPSISAEARLSIEAEEEPQMNTDEHR
ncbi:MAG: Hsp70 family protein [Deltaproteobacteria bacterium]|nr:Hsp70 family protein [Deltaproteobacteria bacterium]